MRFLAGCNSPAFFVPLGMALTIQEYIKKLNQSVKDLESGKAFVSEITQTMVRQADRIFTDGRDYKGRPIGKYSTDPIYIPVESSPIKVKPLGKPYGKPKRAKSVFKTGERAGEPHTSRYWKGGYAEFKKRMKRGGKFNLFLFGNFNRAFLASSMNPTLLTEKTKKIGIVSIKSDASNPEGKIEGLIDNYPNTFKLSAQERKDHVERVSKIWNNAFK